MNCSWLNYDFEVHDPAEARWNEVPGLYVFARWDSGAQLWRPQYIGQARSLANRLPTHEKWPEAEQLGSTHIHARVEQDAQQRGAIERELIQAFKPPLNVRFR